MLDPFGHSEKTARNREWSAAYLRRLGIKFEEKNKGAHLIVSHAAKIVDFWPGTGLWIFRNGSRGRGVRNLATALEVRKP
jgi:hypothetical protein